MRLMQRGKKQSSYKTAARKSKVSAYKHGQPRLRVVAQTGGIGTVTTCKAAGGLRQWGDGS